jgi:hypothetical protein
MMLRTRQGEESRVSDTQTPDSHPTTEANTRAALSPERLQELLDLIAGADTVELKLTLSEEDRLSIIAALDIDPLDAQIRQVTFFDTPDLLLNRHGLVVRARRVQGRAGDVIIKLRPVVPEHLSEAERGSPLLGVEVDAMPGGFVCSATMKTKQDDAVVRATFKGEHPIHKLLAKEQRAFFAAHAPEGADLKGLTALGPINVLKLKFTPVGFDRKLVVELWNYPDGSRMLELSTKCLPLETFQVAAETRAYLGAHGVDLEAPQQTKTRTALDLLTARLAEAKSSGGKTYP